jgi:hypothetical protein
LNWHDEEAGHWAFGDAIVLRLVNGFIRFASDRLLQPKTNPDTPFGDLTSSTPPDTATIVTNRVARLTKILTLTTAQAAQATTIFISSLNAITPLQTTLSTDRTSLAAAVKTNSISMIDQLSASIGSLNGQILDIQSKADAAFYAILDATQKTTLDASHTGRGGRGFGRGPGR